MLNKIILSTLYKGSPAISAMSGDDLEAPANYKGWIYPLRYLLALRYLKVKQSILATFRSHKIYPITEDDYKKALISKLSTKKKSSSDKSPLSAIGFKASLIYPVIITTSLFGLVQLNEWYQNQKVENVLANHLPYFSDLLHRKLLLKHSENPTILKKIDAALDTEQQKILSDLPEKKGIRAVMATQLEKLRDSSTSSEEIMLGFKDVNTLFDAQGLPFYLTPKSFSMPCSSLIDAPLEELMMLKKLEELMSNGKPERCRTTMMTAYKVNHRGRLMYADSETGKGQKADKKEVELPLFHVERIDKVPAVDSALGLTFKERGIGSIILRDRIKNFAEESVLPALTFQGRNYIIPYWMQGYYEIEEAITKGYKKDIEAIYPNKAERIKVKNLVKKLIKNKTRMQNSKMQQTLERTNTSSEKSVFGNGFDAISAYLGKSNKKDKKIKNSGSDDLENTVLLEKLDAVLLPSIELHEAYHQIDKKHWIKPRWLEKTFKNDMSENGLDHTMEELGAYLSQLANTQKGHNIWLSKLLIFSLNPMTKGQAEYYASSIILTTLESLRLGSPIDPHYIASIDKKTEIYKTLTSMNTEEIRELSKRAYEVLFEREVPALH